MNINIDPKSQIPIYQQIVNETIRLISSGALKKGDNLPSVRELSKTLGINPATVARAYRHLEKMCIIETRKGVGSKVASLPDNKRYEQLINVYMDFIMKAREMGFSEKEIIDMATTHSLNTILITDIGSTTTKSLLFRRNAHGKMTFYSSGFSKTTVEVPDEDVWIGIKNSIKSLENNCGLKLMNEDELIIPSLVDSGTDLFLATSSAGGGLQMITVGLTKQYTGESAERTALGAGAIIAGIMAINDGKTPFEKIKDLQELKPDIILLSGGVEGGAISAVVELGEILSFSGLKGKFGDYKIPLIYAGNTNAKEFINFSLDDKFDLYYTENIRPHLEVENPEPARKEIQHVFMTHVMKRAPGYEKVLKKVSSPVLPTPGAVFEILRKYTELKHKNILSFDIGGATTDVFSVYNEQVIRTVSANLGMSYSVLQAIDRAGVENVSALMERKLPKNMLLNLAANKMINPTALPANDTELDFEKAIAKEIIRLSFNDHKKLAVYNYEDDVFRKKLQGKNPKEREVAAGKIKLDLLKINMIIGSGGILSHRTRGTAFEIMADAIPSYGITEFYVDSEFMMPHLGVLSSVNTALALELFESECLVHLGTVISAKGRDKPEKLAFTIKYAGNSYDIQVGDFTYIPTRVEHPTIEIIPTKHFDLGKGPGVPINSNIENDSMFGIICDMRVRPISYNEELHKRWREIKERINYE